MMIYTVKKGDTLSSIARRNMTTPMRLAADNSLTTPDTLAVGQTLVIQEPTMTYIVGRNDTLGDISERFGVSINELKRNNPMLMGRDTIYPGQEIIISLDTEKLGNITVNGYAYTNIDRDILMRALPYLTYLSVFNYGIADDGNIVIPNGDEEIISIAKGQGVAPVLVLSTINERGVFDSDTAVRVLSDMDFQNIVINNLAETAADKGYYAIDIDFEYIPGEYAEEYANFIAAIREKVAPMGMKVFAALSPKVRADQEGLLYEGHDYGLVGEAADSVLLMTYEWGYTYGPNMAVAPLNKVEEVVRYAVSEIPPDKLLMGIPNYGYDFKLPFVRGESQAQSIGNQAAVELAREKGADIQYDTVAQAPFFRYTEDGVVHEVWFEDARSVNASLSLAQQFALTGVGYWNVMRYFAQNWAVLNSRFRILEMF